MKNPNTRFVIIIASAIDCILSGILIAIYFGAIPVDISGWGISSSVLGVIGSAWFLISVMMLFSQLIKKDIPE
jgi:hypothetical protein